MNNTSRSSSAATAAALAVLCFLLPQAHAQYKVIDANGKVTYTDQPPAAAGVKVQPVDTGAAGAGSAASSLPMELRAPAGKYPVTLYSAPGCRPCDAGRQLLQQRGIPYAEKRVQSGADIDAFARLSKDRSLPLLTIGSQQLKGLVSADWQSYLDAAGYPRENRLPASYRAPAATPLAPPSVAAPAAEDAAPASPSSPPPPPASTGGPNIRF